MPKKIVEIRRTNNNAPVYEEGNAQISEYLEPSIQGINVRHESKSKPVPYTGLTYEELKVILPLVVDLDRDANGNFVDFAKKKKDYYNGLIAYVPTKGLQLNIGLEIDNDKPITDENVPENIYDFIKWRALFENDPRVAKNKEEAGSHQYYQFYIVDDEKAEEKEQRELLIKQKAFQHYLSITNSVKELRTYITLMDEGRRVMQSDEKDLVKLSVELNKLLEQNPKKYVELTENKDTPQLYTIQQLLNYNVVEVRPGGGYYDMLSTQKLANDRAGMVKWIKDEANAEAKKGMINLLQEKAKTSL